MHPFFSVKSLFRCPFICQVQQTLRLTPSKFTQRRGKVLDTEALRKRNLAHTRQFKRRRLFLKQKRTVSRKQHEIREGTSYETSVGLRENQISTDMVQEIPAPLPTADFKMTIPFQQCTEVVFDLETTGLG